MVTPRIYVCVFAVLLAVGGSRAGLAQSPFPTRNAIAPPVTSYEDGMARIKAQDEARPKAVPPKLPTLGSSPAEAPAPPQAEIEIVPRAKPAHAPKP
jgi:hypothetical protein